MHVKSYTLLAFIMPKLIQFKYFENNKMQICLFKKIKWVNIDLAEITLVWPYFILKKTLFIILFWKAIVYEGQDKNPEMCRVLLTHEIMCR